VKRALRILLLGPVLLVWIVCWLVAYPFLRFVAWVTDDEWSGLAYWSVFPEVWDFLDKGNPP
jgi:hypothetical protein